MEIYRIHSLHRDAFDTTGSMLLDGRWHLRGTRVIYAAEHISLAALEVLIHAEGEKFPPKALTRIELPSESNIEEAPAMEFTRSQRFGEIWAAETRTVALRVPSAPTNNLEFNYVLNPAHPDFQHIKKTRAQEFPFDKRLLVLGSATAK